MILDEIAGMNETFRSVISNLSKDKKRMTILSLLEKDRNLFKSIKGLIDKEINKMEHIKDVVLMLREYVIVGEVEQQKFGEVMTPMEVVKEMLNTLPDEVWSNPNLKWLDPANGTGPFPIMVIYKLMNGLKDWEPDDEKRYKHIVENMIYVSELQPKNMFLYLCVVDPFDKYKLNIYTGSFIENGFDFHMKNVWGVDKFDIVIGNPPYNGERGLSNNTVSIYPDFIEKSYNMSNSILMITPSRWFGGSSSKEHRENMINKYGLFYIKHFEDNKFFKGTDIKGGVSYFLSNKGYSGKVKFVYKDKESYRDFKSFGVVFINNYDEILNKVILKTKNNNLSSKFRRNGSIQTNDKRMSNVQLDGFIECLASRNRNLFIDINSISIDNSYLNSHKVVTPLAQGNAYAKIDKFIYLPPLSVANSSYILFEFDSKNECDNFIDFLKIDFIQFLISIRKNTQSLTSGCFIYLPNLPMNRKYKTEDIFEYFNFNDYDVKLISEINI
jgi:site-specific DNA-methyltransferase (adenine-specific)